MGSLLSGQGAGPRQPGSGQRAVAEGAATPQQGQGAPDLGSLFQSMMPLAQQVCHSRPLSSFEGGDSSIVQHTISAGLATTPPPPP